MLTRCITSQHVHLSLQESWHLPPSSINLTGQTLESLACLTTLCLPFSSLSPHFPTSLTFNQRGYEKKWSLKLNCHLLPDAKPSKLQYPKRRGTWAPNSICMESTTTEGAPVAEGLPEETNGIGNSRKKKRQRQKHAHNWQGFTRAEFPGGWFPAKFGCQPIKSEKYLLAHAYPANYVRVHFRHLGVYKESRVAYRAIRVRVS